ncbi:MAG: glycosyl hydrolase 2 galactose-binding domain-containing protein, partial [Candidatus Zipacnadales bacterium]
MKTLSCISLITVLGGGCVVAGWCAEPSTYLWIEAEQPAFASPGFQTEGMGRPHLLSGGQWLRQSLDQNQAQNAPAEGFVLRYKLEVPEAGEYEVWARVGFEWVRPPLEWRLGDGEWTTVSPDVATTNVMELAEWVEVAWLLLGKATLQPGAMTCEIRYREPGKDGRMLMALDCLAFTKGHFVPEGRLKPGETYTGDVDSEAAQQVYQLPELAGVARTQVRLTGLWQVARYDELDMDSAPTEPVQALPSPDEYPLRWMGITVPGSLWNKDETIFAHRVIYRTRVNVPATHRGRGFKLHFSGTNWLASVFINGKLAGTRRSVWIPWDLDVSNFIRPGQVNEIAVAIKGPYYAVDRDHYGDEKDLDRWRNRPRNRQDWVYYIEPIYPSTKGDGNGVDYGLVNPVTLVSVGHAYTEDVFIRPSVAEKRLEVDVTVRNTTAEDRDLQILCEAVNDRTNEVEKTFGPIPLKIERNGTATVTVAGDWADPKLWWPVPNPNLYRLRTTLSQNETPVDVQEELFGFREVTIQGTGLYINGVRRNFWNWVDVADRTNSPEQWAEAFRREGNRCIRFSTDLKLARQLPCREDRLEFFDRHGIPGRLCSMIDGMFINRVLGYNQRDPQTGQERWVLNEPVWEGFDRHLTQLAKAYRNHPSVIFYQAENELVYITGMNLYGGHLPLIEARMAESIEAARKVDPTRPYTVGGAGDLSGRLEINCPHYPEGPVDWYPENAYTVDKLVEKVAGWPWDRTKPWIPGESLYAAELELGSYALGDEAFRSSLDASRGKARYVRMVYGGFRWAGVAGFFPWDNLSRYEDGQKIFSDLCVILRKQTHRLYGGKPNAILVKVMNDTLSSAPVTFEWWYTLNGHRIAGNLVRLNIEPGFGVEQTLSITPPLVTKRQEGLLVLKASQEGAPDYIDERSVPVLPTVESLPSKAAVIVLDRSGALLDFFEKLGAKYESIASLAELKGRSGFLLIGPDTLTAEEAFGQDLLTFAAQGGRVIVLEQEIPAAGSNLPAPLKTTTHYGGYAHPKALGTPLFRDLGPDDLIDWAGDHPTYKQVYEKPLQGGRTLAECGAMLRFAPLIEMPCGKGIIVLCQLRVGAKLGIEPAAEILLRNMIEVYAEYQPSTGVVALYAPDNPLLTRQVQDTGALTHTVDNVVAALDPQAYRVAVIHATADNLATLNAESQKVAAFQDAGGWVMLCGLEPEGLPQFNRLVEPDHMLRPFRIERVTLERSDYPLAATLGNRDLSMYSSETIAAWRGQYWVSGDVYSFVVDGIDVAPFCQMPGGPADLLIYEPTKDDKDPYNFVNGLLSSDFWRYIRQIWIPEGGAEPLTFTLRQPETLREIRIWNNAAYWTIQDVDIIFDGDETQAVKAVLPDSDDLTVVKLDPPRTVQKTITLQIRSWRNTLPDRPDLRLVGIDNLQFLRAEPPRGAVFLDNVGGLVAYPRGRGGIFLNQLKFIADDPVAVNAEKKLRILGTILQNMGAGSRTSQVAIPGVNVRFEPVMLTEHCNRYLAAQGAQPGWFGEGNRDLRHFQVGEQTLANVTYHPVDYATAPVPNCIMLGANGAPPDLPATVKGIKIGKRADLLFFLHTAKVTRPISQEERARLDDSRRPFSLPIVARYILHYVNGETAEIPVVLENHIDHWEQAK